MAMTVGVASVFAFLLYSLLGALTRALFGIYKVYKKHPAAKLKFGMVAVEVVASVFFGMFSAMLLQELGWLKVGTEVIALLSGFFGADLIEIVSKKVGLRSGIKVQLAEEMSAETIEYAGLTERQEAGIRYLKKRGRVTNDTYQKLTASTHDMTKHDLAKLVKMKRIKKHGNGRATYYTLH